jgi:hypothetical protein
MIAERILYRTRQFMSALSVRRAPDDIETARGVLAPELMALFQRMQLSDQAHSLQVLHELMERGEMDPDLWVAALLHDVGKSRYPLRLWERVWVVLAKAFFPGQVKRWGSVHLASPVHSCRETPGMGSGVGCRGWSLPAGDEVDPPPSREGGAGTLAYSPPHPAVE